MGQFYNSICLSLLHSLWQSALLLLIYAAVHPVIRRELPVSKRNILYGLMLVQITLSVITFIIYFTNSVYFGTSITSEVLPSLFSQKKLLDQYGGIIFSLYSATVGIKTISLVYNWFHFRGVVNSNNLLRPPTELELFMLVKANEFGISRNVTLWLSNVVSSPITFGFLKPVIILPVSLLSHLSMAETESLLIHELSHIKNKDYLLNWVIVTSEIIFFFNPFLKIIIRKIKIEREKDCDLQVLQFKYPAVDYAETLLKLARFKKEPNVFSLAAVFTNRQLLQRIRFFSGNRNMTFSKKNCAPVFFLIAFMALTINLFFLGEIKSGKALNDVIKRKPVAASSYKPGRLLIHSTDQINLEKPYTAIVSDVVYNKTNNLEFAVVENSGAEKQTATQPQELLNEFEPDLDYALPVVETDQDGRELIVKEQLSGSGEVVTRVYKSQLKDGQWHDELLYIVKESSPVVDSLLLLKDSVIKYIPPMQ